ncbi:MAG: hypothetical protein IPH23_05575 [Gammaproteobacteria bacterium]|nr:hypothetical protein [Gammaproteobacteria bacterium]
MRNFLATLRALRRRPGVSAGMLVVAGLLAGLAVGFRWGADGSGEQVAMTKDLAARLAAERERSAYLDQQLVNRMLAAQVDWKSMEQVRHMMADLEQQLAASKEELNLYRLLLLQDSSVKGLHIEHWRATPADSPGQYDYRLVVRQNVNLREPMKVSLKVVLSGDEAGKAVTYTLAALDEGVAKTVVPLSFRYFKFFEGTLAIPPGFSPREVEVSVWPRDKHEDIRIRKFPWRRGEVDAPGVGTGDSELH